VGLCGGWVCGGGGGFGWKGGGGGGGGRGGGGFVLCVVVGGGGGGGGLGCFVVCFGLGGGSFLQELSFEDVPARWRISSWPLKTSSLCRLSRTIIDHGRSLLPFASFLLRDLG